MATKKYLDLEGLKIFKGKLYENLAPKEHAHTISDTLTLQSTLDEKVKQINAYAGTTTSASTQLKPQGGVITLKSSDLGIDDSLVNKKASDLHVAHAASADDATLATSAGKLTTARNIVLTGAVTGTVSFDGASNVTMSVTVLPEEHQHTIAQVTNLQESLDLKLNKSLLGVAGGIPQLGEDKKVLPSQLPSYVDDVLEFDFKDGKHGPGETTFPESGEDGKIYVSKNDNKTYRWSGTSYIEISASLTTGTTSETAYPGDKGAALATSVGSQTDDTQNASGTVYQRINALVQSVTTESSNRTKADDALSTRIDSNNDSITGLDGRLKSAEGTITQHTTDILTKANITTVEKIQSDLGTRGEVALPAFTQIATLNTNLANEIATRKEDTAKLVGITDTVVEYVKNTSSEVGHKHESSDITDLNATIVGTKVNNATTADQLGTNAGSATQPVYFVNGKPKVITHTIESNVPSDAKFTDTTYKLATGTESGLMSAAQFTKLSGITAGANLYTHPSYTSYESGLYNITVDSFGHISAATKVNNSHIKDLESPIGLVASGPESTSNDAVTDPNITLVRSEASVGTVQLHGGTNVTVTSKGGVITFAAKDTIYKHFNAGPATSESAIYKITSNSEGHLLSAAKATTSDIFGLNGSLPVAQQIASKAVVTDLTDGLMSAADKKKLDTIKANAGVTSIEGIEGKVTKAQLKLDKVNNIPDSVKHVASADKLFASRSFSITGDATATAIPFDGTDNVELSISISAISSDDIAAIFSPGKTAAKEVAAMMAMRKN